MRKCVLGIYLFTFVPLGVTTQFWFPIKGPGTEPPLAPESFLKMPLALITGMGLLAFAGILLGSRTKYELKEKKA